MAFDKAAYWAARNAPKGPAGTPSAAKTTFICCAGCKSRSGTFIKASNKWECNNRKCKYYRGEMKK